MVTVLLKKNKGRTNGDLPVYLRITENRKAQFLSLKIKTKSEKQATNKKTCQISNKAGSFCLIPEYSYFFFFLNMFLTFTCKAISNVPNA
jgi:hypothetical protein